ncbi:hypothetical protein BN2475_440041 [Paraburkholderia ribeironis]|uniref:Uncharacterized protein n=1 Tax=Paraburkholderia ribeironis TaxID=1247936 RepID=A0A1N7S9D9_9BURK|nr:hypothetical protein BN2475_440041 [Paraburkholderia ribeironis]
MRSRSPCRVCWSHRVCSSHTVTKTKWNEDVGQAFVCRIMELCRNPFNSVKAGHNDDNFYSSVVPRWRLMRAAAVVRNLPVVMDLLFSGLYDVVQG